MNRSTVTYTNLADPHVHDASKRFYQEVRFKKKNFFAGCTNIQVGWKGPFLFHSTDGSKWQEAFNVEHIWEMIRAIPGVAESLNEGLAKFDEGEERAHAFYPFLGHPILHVIRLDTRELLAVRVSINAPIPMATALLLFDLDHESKLTLFKRICFKARHVFALDSIDDGLLCGYLDMHGIEKLVQYLPFDNKEMIMVDNNDHAMLDSKHEALDILSIVRTPAGALINQDQRFLYELSLTDFKLTEKGLPKDARLRIVKIVSRES